MLRILLASLFVVQYVFASPLPEVVERFKRQGTLQETLQGLQQQQSQRFQQQRPTSGKNDRGFEVFNGPAAQGSGSNLSRPGGNQQGASQTATTVRSPLNVVSNENTIPEASCVRNCIAVSTYDPICGSDSITYTNRAKFRCAQQCGRRVSEAYRGACVQSQN